MFPPPWSQIMPLIHEISTLPLAIKVYQNWIEVWCLKCMQIVQIGFEGLLISVEWFQNYCNNKHTIAPPRHTQTHTHVCKYKHKTLTTKTYNIWGYIRCEKLVFHTCRQLDIALILIYLILNLASDRFEGVWLATRKMINEAWRIFLVHIILGTVRCAAHWAECISSNSGMVHSLTFQFCTFHGTGFNCF